MKIVIRSAEPDDAESIWDNQTLSWLQSYVSPERGITKKLLVEALEGEAGERRILKIEECRRLILDKDKDHAAFVACYENRVIGSVSPFVADDGRHRLGGFHVRAEFQSQGVGSRLFQRSLEWNKGHDVWVHVISYNRKAIDYYDKRGFVEREDGFVTSPKLPEPICIPIIKMARPLNTAV